MGRISESHGSQNPRFTSVALTRSDKQGWPVVFFTLRRKRRQAPGIGKSVQEVSTHGPDRVGKLRGLPPPPIRTQRYTYVISCSRRISRPIATVTSYRDGRH